MDPMIELIGYLASALVVVSLAMSSVVRLRIASAAGSLLFIIYGALLPSVPLILTNLATLGLNLWYLRKEFSSRSNLGAVPIDTDQPFLVDFLSSHADDIRHTQPEFDAARDGDFVLLLTRDGLPAGAVVGEPDGSTLRLRLDYVMHAYRDTQLGSWLYTTGKRAFTDAGFTRILAGPGTETHARYLRRVGFTDGDHGLAVNLG
ncbi:MAG: hypothetical protein AAGC63_15620 [Propionicimonas sp.]|nr:hypothetical protein [Propionicimonas sp.]